MVVVTGCVIVGLVLRLIGALSELHAYSLANVKHANVVCGPVPAAHAKSSVCIAFDIPAHIAHGVDCRGCPAFVCPLLEVR